MPTIHRKDIEEYLEQEPKARERKNKDKAIVNVLVRRVGFFTIMKAMKEGHITHERLVAFVQAHNSTDRAWRKVLEERPELRGSDYAQKEELEEDVQAQLGYPVKNKE